MIKLALTGGLCSGKSTVAAMLRERGVFVVDADALGHELLQGEAREAVLARFGAAIAAADGSPDRWRLAAQVFADPGALAALEAILHPRIMARAGEAMERAAAAGRGVGAVEAALILEAGLERGFDQVWVVVAEVETRIARFIARSGAGHGGTREQALARMARQWSEAEQRRRADVVIENNNGLEATASLVQAALARLKETQP